MNEPVDIAWGGGYIFRIYIPVNGTAFLNQHRIVSINKVHILLNHFIIFYEFSLQCFLNHHS